MQEKETVARVIRDTDNLEVAARRLGVSRKTLYSRMRQFELPPGTPGRRRKDLGSENTSDAIAIGATILGAAAFFWWVSSSSKTAIQGASATRDIRGLDVLLRR